MQGACQQLKEEFGLCIINEDFSIFIEKNIHVVKKMHV